MEPRKSSFCSTDHVTEQCVTVWADSEFPNRIHIHDLEFNNLDIVTTRESFGKFVQGVKAGEFDDLI